MEEYSMKRVQIPAFGNWDYCDQVPITQYFESAMHAGLIRGHFLSEDTDLFKVPAAPFKPTYHNSHHTHKKVRKGEQQQQQARDQLRKQGSVYDLTTQSPRKLPKATKAVDEDLYKIPPELLYQKPKRKRMLKNLLSGCLGLNCVACA